MSNSWVEFQVKNELNLTSRTELLANSKWAELKMKKSLCRTRAEFWGGPIHIESRQAWTGSTRLIFSHSWELWYLNWFLCSQAVHPDYDLGWSLQWSHITLFYNLVSDLHASLPSCACDGCCLLRLSRDSFTGVALNILLCMNYWASFFRHHCVCISLAFCNLFSFCFFFLKKRQFNLINSVKKNIYQVV
jgi:hypothetical protein